MEAIERATFPTVILHCPHLGRDLRHLLARLPCAQVITGRKTTPGEAGCLAMHKAAIDVARAHHWEWVLVVEDDCLLTGAFSMSRLKRDAEEMLAGGMDTLFGGSVRTHGARVWQEYDDGSALLSVDKLCSAHFVLHHANGFGAARACEQPYDLQLGDRGARCALQWPFTAIQRAGLSGIGLPMDQGDSQRYNGPQVVNYEGLFAAHEAALGGTLGLAR